MQLSTRGIVYHPRLSETVIIPRSAHSIDGVVRERTRRENHIARSANKIRRLVVAAPEIAELIRGVVVEAATGVQ